jgi:hypothetical protein
VEGGEGSGAMMSPNDDGAPVVEGASGEVLHHGEGWEGVKRWSIW